MFYLIKQKWQLNKIKRGKGVWGRQPDPSDMQADIPLVGTISARVIRADGAVEDLGIISVLEEGE